MKDHLLNSALDSVNRQIDEAKSKATAVATLMLSDEPRHLDMVAADTHHSTTLVATTAAQEVEIFEFQLNGSVVNQQLNCFLSWLGFSLIPCMFLLIMKHICFCMYAVDIWLLQSYIYSHHKEPVKPCSRIQIRSKQENSFSEDSQKQKIFGGKVLHQGSSRKLLLAYGSALKPSFENLVSLLPVIPDFCIDLVLIAALL